MARRRKRRPTVAQSIIGVATAGMPQPVRSVLANRSVATLITIALPILLVTGIITIQWDKGLPTISVDQQRAKEIKAQAAESLQKLREKEDGLLKPRLNAGFDDDASTPGSPQEEPPIANLSEILRTLR